MDTVTCFRMTFNTASQQRSDDASFIGGRPLLPLEIPLPSCTLCGKPLSFFFQVAFPEPHPWRGRTIALFAGTDCYHEDELIPEILPGELKGIEVPAGFLQSYQRTFRVVVFETGRASIREDYAPRVKFQRVLLAPADRPDVRTNKVGGSPNWVMDDETPGVYAGETDFLFLLQLRPNIQFDLEPDAPRQMEEDLFSEEIVASEQSHYELFIGNAIYLFGTATGEPLVYALVQKP